MSPVIEGGNVITGGSVDPHTGPQTFHGHGAPVDGTTYDGLIVEGDLYVDHTTDFVYEFTDVDTFTRIDTVA